MIRHHLTVAALLLSASSLQFACDSAESDGQGGGGSSNETGGQSGSTGGQTAGGAGGAGGEGTALPSEWVGETPHLNAAGDVGEKAVSLAPNATNSADLGTFYCERNYIVPTLEPSAGWETEGYLLKVEVKFNFFFEGELAEFQLELEKPDLLDSVGDVLSVGEGEDAQVNIGLGVDDGGPNAAEYEDSAVSGTFTLSELSGTVGADGLTIPGGEGAFGGYVDVTLASGGSFRGSFTANCGDNDFELPE